jgi:NADH dehydrogenase
VIVGGGPTAVEAAGVRIGGDRIGTRNVSWAAGNEASPLGAMLGGPVDRAARRAQRTKNR